MRSVETFRVRQENPLASFGAEINDPPVELHLGMQSRISVDCAVADGFGGRSEIDFHSSSVWFGYRKDAVGILHKCDYNLGLAD